MKKYIRRGLPLLLALLMLFLAVSPVYADEQQEEELKYMAYNFYAAPDLSDTSGRFDSFMIDFRSDKAPLTTYWSLANFAMDLSSTKTLRAYPKISGFGAYAGLQNSNDRKGILSFWEAAYMKDGQKEILTATRVYPDGSSSFGGEGEGTNCIGPYAWENDRWYRMLLHCWEDKETGTTFAGLWFLDVETGKWTLFSYFDTHLYKSYFIGSMSQFMENYWGDDVTTNCNVERTCNLKNMYVFDHVKKSWVSLPTATLSYGDGNPEHEHQKKYGAHTFGATDDYFWGSTGGKVEDQEAYEAAATKHSTHTINQPATPTLGTPVVKELRLDEGLCWELTETSAPQLSYTVKVTDPEGNALFEKTATRPEVRKEILPEDLPEAVKYTLTVTDVFGTATTAELETDAYKDAVSKNEGPVSPTPDDPTKTTETPDKEPTDTENSLPSDTPNEQKDPASPVTKAVVISVASVVTVAVLTVGTVLTVQTLRKRKKK